MAETGNVNGGESTTNTTTSTTGGGRTGSVNNTTTKTSGSGIASNLSSKDTKEVEVAAAEESEKADNIGNASESSLLPYPHSLLANMTTEASAYKDLIKDVYKEHEKELQSDKSGYYEPSAEMIAARDDAQVRLADELRASLKAQRSMTRKASQEGDITVKLSKPHIHDGISYQTGDGIKVDEASAKFIEEAKVGKRA